MKKTVYERGVYNYQEYWVHESEASDFLQASAFKVHDLFCLVPELIDLFSHFEMRNYQLIYCSLSLRQNTTGKLDSLLEVAKRFDLDSLKTKFPTIENYNLLNETPNRFTLAMERRREIKIPSPLVQAENKDVFLIASISNSNRISDINVHIVLMFLLCHIARYKAPLLKEILEGREESKHMALIEKFIEISETKSPRLPLS